MEINEMREYFNKFTYLDLKYLLELLNYIPIDDRNEEYYKYLEYLKDAMEHYFDTFIYVTEDDLYVTCADVKWDRILIKDTIDKLTYNELKYTESIFYILVNSLDKTSELHEECLYLDKYLMKLINRRRNMVKHVIPMGEYTLEDFEVFMDTLVKDSNSYDLYAISCHVDNDNLTPLVMYQTYHKEEKEYRRVR